MNLSTPVLRSLNRLSTTTDFSNRYIAEILGISPGSVCKYQKIFQERGLNWKLVKNMDDSAFRNHVFPRKKRSANKVMPDMELMHERLTTNKDLCLRVFHDEYQSIYKKQAYSYTQLNYHYRRFKRRLKLSARLKRHPGEAFYIDYAGTLIPWVNADKKGQIEKAQVFIMVAGYSGLIYMIAVPSQKISDFIFAHIQGFRYIGGAPEALVPDNLKSAVTTPGKNLVANKAYQELAEYYCTEIIPARVRKPQDKALAEQAVLHATRWITARLKERTFFSVEEINEAISEPLDELNNKKMTDFGKSRRERFEEFERATLKPLPKSDFEYGKWITHRKVPPDYHVKIEKHYYSVPFKRVADFVDAKVTRDKVYFYFENQCIAAHKLSNEVGGFTTNPKHQSPEHRAYTSQGLNTYLTWARTIGSGAERVVKIQYEGRHDRAMVANRACSKLQQLSLMYGNEDFELACLRSIKIGSPNVSRIQSMLKSGMFRIPLESVSEQTLLPNHSNIRGSNYYQSGGSNA